MNQPVRVAMEACGSAPAAHPLQDADAVQWPAAA